MITTKEAITFVKYIADEAYKQFERHSEYEEGVYEPEYLVMITPGFGIKYEHPYKFPKISSVLKYFQVATVNGLERAKYFKNANVSVNVVKRELGITDIECETIKSVSSRDMRGKFINGKFVGYYVN